LLSTYGGEITFPEALISKIRDMGFEKVHTFILDAAFSAGTLLALLSDKIIGFSNSHIGPVDPQLVVSTPQGIPRVVSAMSVKRYIEKVLPKLAEEQKLGKDGLANDITQKSLPHMLCFLTSPSILFKSSCLLLPGFSSKTRSTRVDITR